MVVCTLPPKNFSFKLEDDFSIFTAEAFALLQALNFALSEKLPLVACFSDSLSLITSLRKMESILEAGNSIKIYWIPSHANIWLIEEADALAKAGALKPCIDAPGLWAADALPIFKSIMLLAMNRYYATYGSGLKGMKYRRNKSEFIFRTWFSASKLTRSEICLINRLLTGHTKARSHLFVKGFKVDMECDCGEGPHSLEHLLYDCHLYEARRQITFNKFSKNNIY